MQSMTIEQLRAASNAGGVSGVTLKGQGGCTTSTLTTRETGNYMHSALVHKGAFAKMWCCT